MYTPATILKSLLIDLYERPSHTDWSTPDESMNVATISLNTMYFIPHTSKEALEIVKEALKETMVELWNKDQKVYPTAVLFSDEDLHLCRYVVHKNNRFSLLGKYAKKYNCSFLVFAAPTSSVDMKCALWFQRGLLVIGKNYIKEDTNAEVYVVEKEDLKISLIEPSLIFSSVLSEKQITLLKDIEKPKEDFASLGTISFN